MIKVIVTFTLSVFLWTGVAGQTDSLRKEILNYQDSTAEITSKGRKLILDKFLENDKKKVNELLDYLRSIEKDQDFLAFYPLEKWFFY